MDPLLPGAWWRRTVEALTDAQTVRVPYVDVVFTVAQEEVVHDGSFVQLGQRGHVLHSMDAAGVHRVKRLPVQLGRLQVDRLEQHTRPKGFTAPCVCV